MNIHTPRISLPKLMSKRLLLIVAGVAVVGLLLTFATIRQVQAERAQQAAEAARTAQAYEAVRLNTQRIDDLQKQVQAGTAVNQALAADKQTLCTASKPVVSLRTARTASHCQ